jgi:hypothetical protein
VTFTGEPPGEPLKNGETKKFTLTTAAEEETTRVSVPLWRVWEKEPPDPAKKRRRVCDRDRQSRRFKAQIVTLTVKAIVVEPGAWEQPTPEPTSEKTTTPAPEGPASPENSK